MPVVTRERQRRAGEPAGSFASSAGRAILVGLTARELEVLAPPPGP